MTFAVLCEDLDDPSPAKVIAARVGDALAMPFVVPSLDVAVTASVGIAYAGPGDDIPELILQGADTAMG